MEYDNKMIFLTGCNHYDPVLMDSLGYYVYALIHPDTNEVFYIGKGTGGRIFDHENYVKKMMKKYNGKPVFPAADAEKTVTKNEVIYDILNSGKPVKKLIIHYGLTNEHALLIESALIDLLSDSSLSFDHKEISGLTNEMRGYDSRHGMCVVEKEDDLQNLVLPIQTASIKRADKILALRFPYLGNTNIVNRVRNSYWCLSPAHASQANYVVACVNGIIKGIFKVKDNQWNRAGNSNRYNFDPIQITSGNIYTRLYNKAIKLDKGAANPVYYVEKW